MDLQKESPSYPILDSSVFHLNHHDGLISGDLFFVKAAKFIFMNLFRAAFLDIPLFSEDLCSTSAKLHIVDSINLCRRQKSLVRNPFFRYPDSVPAVNFKPVTKSDSRAIL